jgi:hypothetical protein
MKFYSRKHALRFLDIPDTVLQRAVSHGWIVPIRLGPKATFQSEFFVLPDLVAFRERYKSGYYEPEAVLDRARLQRRTRRPKRGVPASAD